ncbi:Putative ubiquitin-conjugating enzyme E2, von Willebrand factor, type A, U-box [Septoria linicola]|uniref:peptidylprolyl isomerase n=1 Tax=Septoria linicola TaxID=215465 RepID=A0A9Q9AYF4_9PEZI|nr:Putative ubiquitin-conjugating enzyme E2, von Willebrand factor, type A, U-box [Septoria linicola]
MQRYTVTVVDSGAPGSRPTLAVPFEPSALVSAFIDELFRRIARRGLKLSPNTHIATLHLDSETGAIIDAEDVLSDVISDPRSEKIYAVFAGKQTSSTSTELVRQQLATSSLQGTVTGGIRPVVFDKEKRDNECNCSLAKKLADGPGDSKYFFVLHGKSIVKRVQINTLSEQALDSALQAELGLDLVTTKKITRHGAELRTPGIYAELPVVAVCSKVRHIPVHARIDSDDSEDDSELKYRVVDLHTSEQPISAECMGATLAEAAFGSLVRKDGIIEVFVVNRSTVGASSNKVGKNAMFRARPHWEPGVRQTARGVAMFLSSLRVFTSLASESDKRNQDALLHVIDLMTWFPPCIRAMSLLIQGKTVSAVESAAIADCMYELLHEIIIPSGVVGTDAARLFEDSRLLMGFILEKAQSLKLAPSSATEDQLPYLSSTQTRDLKDYQTGESVFRGVLTTSGLVERSLFEAFQESGALFGTHLQCFVTALEVTPSLQRNAILAGGSTDALLVFHELQSYIYIDAGNIDAAIDMTELSHLNHLAEIAARNQLAVHRPSQLTSAVAPSLTFDRDAHLAVYTGQQACGGSGDSSLVFRPRHGEETFNTTVVEQLIAPIIKQYEAEGTAVFDSYGGALLRRLQAPDEILLFCVDTSASMRASTDFQEVNDEEPPVSEPEVTASSLVGVEDYGKASFDEMKDFLAKYEGLNDMIGMVKDGDAYSHRTLSSRVLRLLQDLIGYELVAKHKELEQATEHANGYYARQRVSTLETALNKLKLQWAGLQTHDETLQDFLVYRATTSPDINTNWQWSLGEYMPASRPGRVLPSLPAQLTAVPEQFRCPISHALMEDPVKAADGFTYSRPAIEQWFNIRLSSPMTGLPLQSRALTTNDGVAAAVTSWITGSNLQEAPEAPRPAKKTRLSLSKRIVVKFLSKDGSFDRELTNETTVSDLYRIAFRGMKARFVTFQLALDDAMALQPSNIVLASSVNVTNGKQIIIRVAGDDDPTPNTLAANTASRNMPALVKVYRYSDLLFSYWTDRGTTQTLTSVLWKFWRCNSSSRNYAAMGISDVQVWIDLKSNGDGYLNGHPRPATVQLNHLLNASHCHGKLGDEPVWSDGQINASYTPGTQNHPLVLKVQINDRVKTSRSQSARLSRLDVLKQMFEAYINRMVAYSFKSHVGLVTFDSTPTVKTSLTHVIENFRRATVNMAAHGDTALWDALALGLDQLNEYAKKWPTAKKRIVVISDGDDTKSVSNNAAGLTFSLRGHKIIVDSVALGNENSIDLRMLSQLTGGYRFKPSSLVNALSMVEMEPFFSLTERPDSAVFLPANAPNFRPTFENYLNLHKYSARITTVTSENFPARKSHENLEHDFIRPCSSISSPSRSMLAANELRTYDVYVSESDMSFWKVVMDGPEGSPYQGGTFLLYLHAGESYPTFAPEARFVTRMMHPNINAHGRICHALLSRDWTSDITMTNLLDTVFGLLMQAEVGDASNTLVLDYHHDQVDFADEVRKHVGKHAKKTRRQWKKELIGED